MRYTDANGEFWHIVIGANNSIVAQTGYNFDGFNQVNWGQVGKSAAVIGVASGVGVIVGGAVSNLPMLINGF
ncbi:hypothetical protein LJC00_00825 [Dysgonomonas sp. OttesenSCG-928-M03]|nr:hypothetical protein [Dysgonomonas sp. OttesenSCG-928-M03]